MKEPCKECDKLDGRNQLEIANLKDQDGRPLIQQTKMTVKIDSAEQKELLEQLKASEKRFKRLTEASFEAILIHEKGKIIDVNQQFLDLHGFSQEELQTLDSIELIAPEYRDTVKEKIVSGFQGTYELAGIRKDGSTFPLEVRVRTVRDQGHDLRIVVGRDMTQQKQKEQQFKASEERFRRLAEAAFEAIAIHQDGRIIDVNQQYLDMFGYTLDEVKQINGIEMIAPQSHKLVKEKMTAGYEGPYEAFGIKKNGTIFPIEIQAKESILDGQRVRIGAIKDLSNKKEMEHQLLESERRYKQLYDNSPVALYRTQISDGKLLECNKALVELFGYDSKEEFQAAGNSLERYVNPNDRQIFLEKLKENKKIDGLQIHLKRKNGESVWIEATAEIFPEQGFIEGAMRDITVTKCLTKTEKKVLDQLMLGKSNKEIAKALGRSIRTIEDHRSHIMSKLEVDNLVDLTQKVFKLPSHRSEE